MQLNLQDVPNGFWALVSLLMGSPIITSVVLFFLNKKKTNAETENVIGNSYKELLDAYKEERSIISKEMETMRNQQTAYLENSNELLKSNRILSREVNEMKSKHEDCDRNNQSLNQALAQMQEKLKKHGIN